MPRWLIWPLRLMVVVSVAPVLLFGSNICPISRVWIARMVTGPRVADLGGLGRGPGGLWALLAQLARRARGLSHPVCLAGTIAGAAVTVMLSGYASGGQIGLPLAAALLGASVAALCCRGHREGPARSESRWLGSSACS